MMFVVGWPEFLVNLFADLAWEALPYRLRRGLVWLFVLLLCGLVAWWLLS